jgi:hypothetical protein
VVQGVLDQERSTGSYDSYSQGEYNKQVEDALVRLGKPKEFAQSPSTKGVNIFLLFAEHAGIGLRKVRGGEVLVNSVDTRRR